MIKKIWRAICAWWLERRVRAIYNAYHASLMPNIYDGMKRWGLPEKTFHLRDKFNRAVARLKQLDPQTTWKIMN